MHISFWRRCAQISLTNVKFSPSLASTFLNPSNLSHHTVLQTALFSTIHSTNLLRFTSIKKWHKFWKTCFELHFNFQHFLRVVPLVETNPSYHSQALIHRQNYELLQTNSNTIFPAPWSPNSHTITRPNLKHSLFSREPPQFWLLLHLLPLTTSSIGQYSISHPIRQEICSKATWNTLSMMSAGSFWSCSLRFFLLANLLLPYPSVYPHKQDMP